MKRVLIAALMCMAFVADARVKKQQIFQAGCNLKGDRSDMLWALEYYDGKGDTAKARYIEELWRPKIYRDSVRVQELLAQWRKQRVLIMFKQREINCNCIN